MMTMLWMRKRPKLVLQLLSALAMCATRSGVLAAGAEAFNASDMLEATGVQAGSWFTSVAGTVERRRRC